MSAENKRLDRFFDSVVGVLYKNAHNFHWPLRKCFEGRCERRGISSGLYSRNSCNWEPLVTLIEDFFDNAPDVPQGWKAKARKVGLHANHLHEILIAVFLGSDDRVWAIPEHYVSATKAKWFARSVSEEFLRLL